MTADQRLRGNDYSAAAMVTGPSATARANPLGVISTMDGSELVQSTDAVMSLPAVVYSLELQFVANRDRLIGGHDTDGDRRRWPTIAR